MFDIEEKKYGIRGYLNVKLNNHKRGYLRYRCNYNY